MTRGGVLRALLLPTALTLAGASLLVSLGVWQIERKEWKEKLIAAISSELHRPPSELPPKSLWPNLDASHAEFRRVRFPAEFLSGQEALVYSIGSVGRGPPGPGYLVFARARLPDGDFVVVDLGFVPEGRQHAALVADPSGPVNIVGVMRWPEQANLFSPADNPARNLWFRRDHLAIASAKGWGQVAPFYVDLESPAPASGLPQPMPPSANLRNNHLQYALTWFGLAAALLAVYAVFACGRARALREAKVLS